LFTNISRSFIRGVIIRRLNNEIDKSPKDGTRKMIEVFRLKESDDIYRRDFNLTYALLGDVIIQRLYLRQRLAAMPAAKIMK
jgi:hypothetical protein